MLPLLFFFASTKMNKTYDSKIYICNDANVASDREDWLKAEGSPFFYLGLLFLKYLRH